MPLLHTEALRHMAVAPLAAVNAVPITCELPAPALLCGQTHAHQQGQLTPAGTIGHAFIEDLQCLLQSPGDVNRPRPLPRRPGSILRP